MSSWRISTRFIDLSETVNLSTAFLGYTVIDALKGPETPVLIPRGSTQSILDIFGYPTTANPAIQDAIDANLVADLWVSAPFTNGAYGGVFVTSAGTIPFVNGFTTKTIADYSAIPVEVSLGTGDGVETDFGATIDLFSYYNNTSIDIEVAGTSDGVSATDAEPEVLTGTDGAGTYTRATGVLAYTLTTPPAVGEAVTATYTIDLSSVIYFTLFNASQQADDLAVQVVEEEGDGTFIITVNRYNETEKAWFEITGSPVTVSINPLGEDGYGRPIYAEDVFPDDSILFTADVVTETFTTFTDDTAQVALAGGGRGDALTGSDLASAYDPLQDTFAYPASVVFATTDDAEIATKFETLRNTYQTRTRFMLPTTDVAPATVIATPATYNNGVSTRGVYYYTCTWGIHRDVYRSKNFNCSMMGLVAGRMLSILINGPGGNPQWINNGGNGGQLGSSVVSLNQSPTQTELQQLDKLRFNAVIFHPLYGAMIEGGRTTLTRESDYSYIGQSSLADYIVKAVEEQVLPFQIGKPNNDFYRSIVAGKARTIMTSVSQWLDGNDPFTVICDRSNNTADILQQQKFVLSVAVKFTPYSQTIQFNFVNSPQGLSTEEVVLKTG